MSRLVALPIGDADGDPRVDPDVRPFISHWSLYDSKYLGEFGQPLRSELGRVYDESLAKEIVSLIGYRVAEMWAIIDTSETDKPIAFGGLGVVASQEIADKEAKRLNDLFDTDCYHAKRVLIVIPDNGNEEEE